jgi:hypothetical protein
LEGEARFKLSSQALSAETAALPKKSNDWDTVRKPNRDLLLWAFRSMSGQFGNSHICVSPFVRATFINLGMETSFTPPFFVPTLGQTQLVSAAFTSNSDWTLTIINASSNSVKTTSGSGMSRAFNWDGTGNGGTNLPAGIRLPDHRRKQVVKTLAILTVTLVTAFSSSAERPSLKELNSHLFTNAVIVWQAPTDRLPKSFWVYQRLLPRVFPETVISNAIVLGSLQSKGFPKPSTNDFSIAEPHERPEPAGHTIFAITPGEAYLYYSMPNYTAGSGKEIPNDETVARRAWKYASQLGLDPAMLVQKTFYTHVCETDQNGEPTHPVCGRGVFLSRQLHGVAFFSARDQGDGAEGFSMEFGRHGQIRFFSLRWSTLEPYERQQTISPQEIIRCIRAHKTFVLPNGNEAGFFERLNRLASAKKLTITNITPYYWDFVFGEMPTNDVPCRFATPLAELEAVADFGNSNATVRLISPIIASDASRLLGK